jgi:hypothetical protein
MENKTKTSIAQHHSDHREANWPLQNWRAWGSWFSWGSPVGLGIGYALIVVSTGVFIWLINL